MPWEAMGRMVSRKNRDFEASLGPAPRLVFSMHRHFGFHFDSFMDDLAHNDAMPTTRETSSAGTDRQQIIDAAFDRSREEALKEAAQQELKVSDVQKVQKEKLDVLLKAKGTDGQAALGEDLSLTEDIQAEVTKKIDDEHDDRMDAISSTPGAYVFERKDETAAVQDDADRSVGIAHDGFEDMDDLKRRADHEGEHQKQETGDQVADFPPTGDTEIDKERTLTRSMFRENGAIEAEGGLNGHTTEYEGFVTRSNRIAQYLKRSGEDGDALVKEAAKTNAGFQELHESLVIAAIKKSLADGKGIPEFSKN